MRHFLVTRELDLGLSKIEVFASPTKAVKAYEKAEQAQRKFRERHPHRTGSTCVLLGADRLGILLKTHGDWFDEPVDFELFRDLARLAGVNERPTSSRAEVTE